MIKNNSHNQILLCAAPDDDQVAKDIYDQLKRRSLNVWLESEDIFPGENRNLAFKKALSNSDVVIALFSSQSVSQRGTIQKKYRQVLDAFEEIPEGEIFIIPVRLDECSIPQAFSELTYVDIRQENSVERIVSAIEKFIERKNTSLQDQMENSDGSVPAQMRFTSHIARFKSSPEMMYFTNITNLGRAPVEITHLWYEHSNNNIRINPKSRPLPVRLEPHQVWCSWIPVSNIPNNNTKDAFEGFRLRLSSGDVFSSIEETSIPSEGTVPGGSILPEDISPLKKVDLKKESLRDEWPIYQVAFLWYGFEPPSVDAFRDLMSRDISDMKDLLHAKVDSGEIKASKEHLSADGQMIRRDLNRVELKKFAAQREERPDFLYREEPADTKDVEFNSLKTLKHIRILILASNPVDSAKLRLDKEVREIREGLRRANLRDRFTIEAHWAVRPKDLRRAMLDYEPHIVHFCGHGKGGADSGIYLEDNDGQSKLVEAKALADLFELFTDNLRCVVLNACYSAEQAKAIKEHIAFVVGMTEAIGDAAAVEFATAFYDGLGSGTDIPKAFAIAKNALALERIPGENIPVLL